MNDNKLLLSGVCPYCPAVLDYSEDSRAVTCHSCGNTVPTRILRPLDFAKKENKESENDRRIADGVTSSSAGVIYFDNFCDTFDWKEFALHSALTIPTLNSIAEACKIKFSADPITYYLDFRCKAIPILKKIEGLNILEIEIIDNYKSDDISDLFEYVDRYSSITKAIETQRGEILTLLAQDIKLAKRFGIDPVLAADLERTYAMFAQKVNSIVHTDNIEEIPGYQKAKYLKDKKLEAQIRKKGIDAEKTYVKALELMESGNVDNALHLFAAINGYKDSAKYMAENSMIFKFNDELVEMAGRYYLVKQNAPAILDPQNPEIFAPVQERALSLYQVVEKIPSPKPCLNLVTDIIYNFGSKIFYVRNNNTIACYNTTSTDYTRNVKILDEAPNGDYVIRHKTPVYFSADKTKFFIRKKLREATTTKRGCFGFGRKKIIKKPANNRKNNYSVLLVDMDNSTSKIILPEIVDIMDYYNDKIFYTALDNGSYSPAFRVYDIKTGKSSEILDSSYVIHNVSGGNIICSHKIHSEHNMNLYSMNIKTQELKCIDTNIRSYYETHGNRVFYIVGSRDDKRLYSANLDGSDKCEIMENPGRICTFSSGWLYYINGEGVNTCLMKVSIDGTKNMLVASRFGKLVKMLDGYIYYIATNGDLKFVRSDGTNDTRIAPAIDDLSRIIIDREKIYYLKRDDFGVREDNSELIGYSLYSTDLYGKNLRKLSHDVSAMVEYSDKKIYLCKKRYSTYERVINTQVSGIRKDKKTKKLAIRKADTVTTELITTELTYYEAYDKTTGEFTEIVRLGAPESKPGVSYKGSRLPFTKRASSKLSVSEIAKADIIPNVREGIAEPGMIEREEILAEERELNRKKEEKAAKKAAKKKAKQDKKAKKAAKKKAKQDKKLAAKIAKNDKKAAKQAKKDEKAAKKEAKRQEKERINDEKHQKMNEEIDNFIEERNKLEEEQRAKLAEEEAEREKREIERDMRAAEREEFKANEREAAKAKKEEKAREKRQAEDAKYNEEMSRYEEEMMAREEAKKAKRDSKSSE